MLLKLIEEFDDLCASLLASVRRGDETSVDLIDAEIQPLVRRIFGLHAQDREEIRLQLEFFARLAVQNSEDDDSVCRYTTMMTALFDRYLGSSPALAPLQSPPRLASGYDASLHELLLDSVPERVAVVGLDYRYIYCNERNADFHEKPASSFIGKHLTDFIDAERFETRAKPRLDQCFGGARVSYRYEAADAGGRMYDVSCRMTPFHGPDRSIVGAVILLSSQPMFARVA
ncbi:PAS domain-containing protein [uncultured Hoeflea sp.]|uniref:PAS domain-containing protein n=1 Tax=uncultured Hoeflea sp. TaxID=538666 RepID=UPI00261A6E94|nr:PAS domain-containing protein [uncultured Hoeflea sp.]